MYKPCRCKWDSTTNAACITSVKKDLGQILTITCNIRGQKTRTFFFCCCTPMGYSPPPPGGGRMLMYVLVGTLVIDLLSVQYYAPIHNFIPRFPIYLFPTCNSMSAWTFGLW